LCGRRQLGAWVFGASKGRAGFAKISAEGIQLKPAMEKHAAEAAYKGSPQMNIVR